MYLDLNYITRFGTEYGGFYYPSDLPGLNRNSIIYCFGAGEDISHDIEISKKINSKVYIFDPTPRASYHVDMIKNYLDTQEIVDYEDMSGHRQVGGGIGWDSYWDIIKKNKIKGENIIFSNIGIGVDEGLKKFYKPVNDEYVSHSLVEGFASDEYVIVEIKNLKSIMKKFNHDKIDLLKLDVEGVECEVIEDMLSNNIFPQYISVDFDMARKLNHFNGGQRFNNVLKLLYDSKYRIVISDSYNISFIRCKR